MPLPCLGKLLCYPTASAENEAGDLPPVPHIENAGADCSVFATIQDKLSRSILPGIQDGLYNSKLSSSCI